MNNSNSINETETKDYSVEEFPFIIDIITSEITSESMFRLDLFIQIVHLQNKIIKKVMLYKISKKMQ